MWRRIGLLSLLTTLAVLGLSSGIANASVFISATAQTSGESLEINFVERGLQPGQNYDYVPSSSSATETFQCYKSRTFTPTHRIITVTTANVSPDVRIYQANSRGVVRGFVFVNPVLPPFHGCGARLETVPIHISYQNFSLVNGVTFDYLDVTGTFSGAIEPD
jgi:hypothetical protein